MIFLFYRVDSFFLRETWHFIDFPAEFYYNFWDVIKSDLLNIFASLHAGQLELFRLNFGEIILLPKIKDV